MYTIEGNVDLYRTLIKVRLPYVYTTHVESSIPGFPFHTREVKG